jgi:ubiquinone/menaquinone biosynthesis C-methylase UbiE
MSEPRFDVHEVFAANDYLYFYGPLLTEEHTTREVQTIARLLEPAFPGRTLDVACGHGRIANQLAGRGCTIVGLDLMPDFIDLARRDAEARGVAATYVQGDMRQLPFKDGEFEAGINWFTAFGYFDDEDNRRVLVEVCRVLKPGGVFLLEHQNRDYVLPRLQYASVIEREGNYQIDQTHYEVSTGRLRTERTILRDGTRRQMQFFVRSLSFPELATWLREAGFENVEGYNEEGSPLGLNSKRMIVRAQK